jgi:hypothetical protein
LTVKLGNHTGEPWVDKTQFLATIAYTHEPSSDLRDDIQFERTLAQNNGVPAAILRRGKLAVETQAGRI